MAGDPGTALDRDAPVLPRRSMFLVWAPRYKGTRSSWLAESLGIADLRYLSRKYERGLRAAWRKYPWQLLTTVRLLISTRPRVVFVQSPPSFAAWTAVAYASVSGAAVVIDAHSDAFERGIWTRPRWLTRAVARRAVATIVTNEHWADLVRRWGATAVTVPSIPTSFVVGPPPPLRDGHNVAVVNTWASDEPLDAVLDAATRLPDVAFHVTGRIDRVAGLGRPIPDNVHFTGFLAEDAYHGLLAAADVVMCLTTRDHTMQNGAAEALSHGTPIVTSNWAILRDHFAAGTAHVDNTPAGIADGVRSVLDDLEGHRRAVRALREQRLSEWLAVRDELVELVTDRLDRRSSSRRAGRQEGEP